MLKKITIYISTAAMALGLASPLMVMAVSEPIVQPIAPSVAAINVPILLTATYSDPDSVSSCNLYVDGASKAAMTLAGTTSGTASATYTFTNSGSYQVQARCLDAYGYVGLSAATTVSVNSSALPTVGAITSTTATINVSKSFSATYSDSDNITSCSLYADGSLAGSMTLSSNSNSGTATGNYNFTSTGNHTLQARCTDVVGNVGVGQVTTIVVSGPSIDLTTPTIPSNLRRTSIGSVNTVTFRWNDSSDNVGVTGYQVSVDGSAYSNVGNTTTYTTTILTTGSHSISVRAIDASGNVSAATTLSFSVPEGVIAPTPFDLEFMFGDASLLATTNSRADLEARTGRPCELSAATAETRVTAAMGNISDVATRVLIQNFMACGTPSSLNLGAGERLGIVNSFRAAFGRLPTTQTDWYDVLKIGNGRFPGQTSATAESRAKASFRLVYLRDPNMAVTGDNNAVVVMTYGLRPLPRNMSSEAAAIASFKAIYGRMPTTAVDWDTVRAIAYSGATR